MIYVANDGNDSNDGATRATPVLTPARVKILTGGIGRVIMLAGVYLNWSFDASGAATNINFTPELGADVQVVFGQRLTSFTLHTGNVWKASATDPHPSLAYVFAWGVPKPMTGYTLPHYPLAKASSVADVSTSAGRWYYENSELFVRMPDSLTPNGTTIHIPSANVNDSFIYGGTGNGGIVVVNRIKSFFGYHGFNFSGLRWGAIYSSLGYGASVEGCVAENFIRGDDTNCSWIANSDDGLGLSGPASGSFRPYWHTRNCKALANADEGISGHYLMNHDARGGFYEDNVSGGITPYGGCVMNVNSPTTRRNFIGIFNFSVAGVPQPITITNQLSEDEQFGFSHLGEGEPSRAILANCHYRRANYGLTTQNPTSFITGTNVTFEATRTLNLYGYSDNITLI